MSCSCGLISTSRLTSLGLSLCRSQVMVVAYGWCSICSGLRTSTSTTTTTASSMSPKSALTCSSRASHGRYSRCLAHFSRARKTVVWLFGLLVTIKCSPVASFQQLIVKDFLRRRAESGRRAPKNANQMEMCVAVHPSTVLS